MKYLSVKKHSTILSRIGVIIAIMTVALATAGLLAPRQQALAADTSQFDPGNIIADGIFYNSSTMSVGDIQNFLNSKVTSCNTNHAGFKGSSGTSYNPQWICLKNYYENPDSTYSVNFGYKDTNGNDQVGSRTYYNNNDYKYTALCPVYKGYDINNFSCGSGDYRNGLDHLIGTLQNVNGAIPSGAISAAQIIYNVSQQYGINPQVLIVLLQKEQTLVTDTWPGPAQYQSATGYGCPDVSPCAAGYSGFSKQVASAAWQFKKYQANPSGFNYVAGRNNDILWNPTASCGKSTVFIQNQATAGLYNYTPYRPNAAALAAGYGEGDNCSSYGNRNFWLYFNDWFGSSTIQVLSPFADKYASLGGANGALGKPSNNQVCGGKDGGCYQFFQNGVTMYWSSATGTHTIGGGIRAKWSASGSEWGPLGYPISDEQYGNRGGGAYQLFQGGRIYYLSNGQSFVILNNMIDRWNQANAEWGVLGYPITDTICGINNGGCYQMFQNNIAIYWSSASGAHTIAGGIRAKWGANGSEWSPLGYPTSDEQYGNNGGGAFQLFQGGRIYYLASGQSFIVLTNIYNRWNQSGADWGSIGNPTSDTICGTKDGGCYQIFQNATIYWSTATGAHAIGGGIRAMWGSTGSEWGRLGYPTSEEQYSNNTAFQNFQGGTVTWYFSGAPTTVTYNN
jgi:uncharacterized protein with LGFP repeats